MELVRLEARISKIITVLGSVLSVFAAMMFIGLSIFFVILITRHNEQTTMTDISGDWFGLVFSLIVSAVLIGALVYIIWLYKKQADLYYDDRFVRKRGKKIIFEVLYSNIIEVGFADELIVLKLANSVIMPNGKKGPRCILGHYSMADVTRARHLIGPRP